jgi:Holliday junction resolvasome RuvABC endonuclease subunit
LTLVLGIDPGKNGAAALIRVEAGVITRCHVGPIILDLLPPMVATAGLVVVEAQHASPQMGVRSAFALGMAYGGVRGALAGLNHPWVEYVQPAVWRGSYGLGGGAAGKVAGIALARELLNDPERALTHDEADAVLLAWWGWRNVLNK